MDPSEILKAAEQFATTHPDVQDLLEEVKAGRLSEHDFAVKVAGLFLEHQELPTKHNLNMPPEYRNLLGDRPVARQVKPGMWQLDPLYEAALLERASIDGDVPEGRSGPLPEGGKPAVPVETSLISPLYVGWMLERASEEVAKELKTAVETWEAQTDRVLAAIEDQFGGDENRQAVALALASQKLPARPIGVPGYEPGQVPAMRSVQPPTWQDVENLSISERQRLSAKAIRTTQGRRSLAGPIEDEIASHLQRKGYKVTPADLERKGPFVRWTTVLLAEQVQINYDGPRNAAAVLAAKLRKEVSPGPVRVRVFPYNGVADREFGWVLRWEQG
jgi:hypothetical protein